MSTIIKRENKDLANALRRAGLGNIVDSPRVRKALGIPIRRRKTGLPRTAAPSIFTQRLAELPPGSPPWQRLKILQDGAATHATDIQWQRALAIAAIRFHHYAVAESAALQAESLRKHDADDSFRLAHIHMLVGEHDKSGQAAARGIAKAYRQRHRQVAKLGLGGYFERLGEWDLAARTYKDQYALAVNGRLINPDDLAELAYRTGLANDRCYRWSEAEDYYRVAASHSKAGPYRVYKLGLALEKQEKWHAAASAYQRASSLPHNRSAAYHLYRAAYCLNRAGDYRGSTHVFFPPEYTPDRPTQRVELPEPSHKTTQGYWLHRSHDLERGGDLVGAAAALKHALDRSERHPKQLWTEYAHLHYRMGNDEQASSAIVETRLFQTPDGIDLRPYNRRSAVALATRYEEYRATRPVAGKVILFESYHGNNASCNPLSIYTELAKRPEYSDYTFVWSLRPDVPTPSVLADRDNVVVVKRQSDAYLRYLATAERLVTNVSLPAYFSRRDGQRLLNTWHGTPLKTLGKDIKPGLLQHSNVARNFLHSTHVISSCPWLTEVILDRYDVRSLFRGQIAELGSPRCDQGLLMSDHRAAQIRQELGILPGQKVVLYAPTWRGLQDDPGADIALTEDALQELSQVPDAKVLFRGHHFMDAPLKEAGLADTQVPESIDTNELLAVVDLLVTDYSSVLFDFLPFDKPMVFYVPDIGQYEDERGLYFTAEELPGSAAYDLSALSDAVSVGLRGVDTAAGLREQWRIRYASLQDGHATQRAIDFFFDDDWTNVVDTRVDKPQLLLRGAMIPNGITTSLTNLMESVGTAGVDVTMLLDTGVFARATDRQQQVELLPDDITCLGRVGTSAYTAEDRWLVRTTNRTSRYFSPEYRRILTAAFTREFRRVFGPATFDTIVEFDGYAPFWANLCAAGPTTRRKLIYQHNDLYSEWHTRFPELALVFDRYSDYDRLVSVAPSLKELNRKNLSAHFDVDSAKIVAAQNQMNPKRAARLKDMPLDDDIVQWSAQRPGHTFITVGRLSIEKAQGLLLRSFADVVASNQAKLIIVGDGFLKEDLEGLADQLGVSDRVLFTGQLSNPISVMAHADTFVLTSSHEGQPMVLGEAMLAGLDIIATDLPGTRDILGHNEFGVLVRKDRSEITAEMKLALHEGLRTKRIDVGSYVLTALEQFSSLCEIPLTLREGYMEGVRLTSAARS